MSSQIEKDLETGCGSTWTKRHGQWVHRLVGLASRSQFLLRTDDFAGRRASVSKRSPQPWARERTRDDEQRSKTCEAEGSPVCPACLTTLALIAAGATATGGLGALAARVLRTRADEPFKKTLRRRKNDGPPH